MIIRSAKGLQLMKNIFITHLSTFSSKVNLTLQIMDLENVALTKVVHIYVIEGTNALYIGYKIILCLKCSVKWGI